MQQPHFSHGPIPCLEWYDGCLMAQDYFTSGVIEFVPNQVLDHISQNVFIDQF